jgi:hypothetical protein
MHFNYFCELTTLCPNQILAIVILMVIYHEQVLDLKLGCIPGTKSEIIYFI